MSDDIRFAATKQMREIMLSLSHEDIKVVASHALAIIGTGQVGAIVGTLALMKIEDFRPDIAAEVAATPIDGDENP